MITATATTAVTPGETCTPARYMMLLSGTREAS
jgi:hypothetical protein